MNKEQALNVLADNKFKMTKRREAILNFFSGKDKYHTAKSLYHHMEDNFPGISFDTVYRNLHLYHDLGILESTNLHGEKHFRMSCSQEHHHHFICSRCGKITHIHICPMEEVEKELAHYKIEGHKFEIYGLCPACRMAS